MTHINHYNVGDEVWYVSVDCIAIKSKIIELDDYRQIYNDPQACVFYWVDEPHGHGFDIYNVALLGAEGVSTKELAKEVLLGRRNEILRDLETYINFSYDDLVRFDIMTTRGKTLEEFRGYRSEGIYRSKKRISEWFNNEDIDAGRV